MNDQALLLNSMELLIAFLQDGDLDNLFALQKIIQSAIDDEMSVYVDDENDEYDEYDVYDNDIEEVGEAAVQYNPHNTSLCEYHPLHDDSLSCLDSGPWACPNYTGQLGFLLEDNAQPEQLREY